MTRLETFAAMAMQGMLAACTKTMAGEDPANMIAGAWEIADAMEAEAKRRDDEATAKDHRKGAQNAWKPTMGG